MNLYLTEKALIDAITNKNAFYSLVIDEKHCKVYQSDLYSNPDFDLDKPDRPLDEYGKRRKEYSQFCRDHYMPESAVDEANWVKTHGLSENQDSSMGEHDLFDSVFVINGITEDMSKIIGQHLGVVCINDDIGTINQLFLSIKYDNNNELEIEETPSNVSDGWATFIKPFKNLPINTILLIDRYAFTPRESTDYKYNLKEIFTQLLKNKAYFFHINVMVFSSIDKPDDLSKKSQALLSFFNECQEELSIIFKSAIFITLPGTELYDFIHKRRFMANYGFIHPDQSFIAFKPSSNKNPIANYKYKYEPIGASNILTDKKGRGTFDNGISDLFKSFINTIKDNRTIPDRNFRNQQLPFSYIYFYENHPDYSKTLKPFNYLNIIRNFLIPNNGNPCFYLSVPEENSWHTIKVKTGIYDKNNWEKRVFSPLRFVLDKKAKEIKKLFEDASYRQVNNDDVYFYKIIVPDQTALKKLHIEQSKKEEKASNQQSYRGNCFANEKDANDVAGKIWEILFDETPPIRFK